MTSTNRNVLTFVAGLVVGGAAVLLSPSSSSSSHHPQPPQVLQGGGEAPPVPGAHGSAAMGVGPDGQPGGGAPAESPPSMPPLPDGVVEPAPYAPEAPPVVGDARAARALAGGKDDGVPGARLLQEHLGRARAGWSALAEEADRSSKPTVRDQAGEMRRVARLVPDESNHFPPLQDVVILLVEERLLVDQLREIGFDAGDLGREIDTVLTRTVGKTPGGATIRARELGVDLD